jgi:hypothetical protein
MFKYSIDEGEWQQIDFDRGVKFNRNCRMVHMPDTSLLLIGGLNQNMRPCTDVFTVFPNSGYLRIKPHMLRPRESPACCLWG